MQLSWWEAAENLLANAGDPGSIPGPERPLEKKMAALPWILAGKSQGQRSLEGHQSFGYDLETKQKEVHFRWQICFGE